MPLGSQPLFPGENAVDQLVEIIKVLGTPTREEIRCMNPNYTDFRFPQIKAHPWHKVFHKRMPPEAIDLASRLLQYSPSLHCTANCEILCTERVGDLNITVFKDASNASCKVDTKVDGIQATGVNQKDLVERNLLKGITADENTTTHDIATLGVVNVRYCGYVAIVKVDGRENKKVGSPSQSLEFLE